MLTNKGKYGLKAMVHLAELPPGALAQVVEIAEANSISQKFLSHILTELRRAGFVYSKKGKGGGYGLARPAHEIRVGAIVRALDGPLAPLPCASVTAFRPCDDCADLQTCAVRLIMIEARNAIASVLDNRALAELRRNRASLVQVDPIQLVRQGEDILRSQLERLNLDQLHDIIAAFAMDTDQHVMKWRSPELMIERIVEVSLSRAKNRGALRNADDGDWK